MAKTLHCAWVRGPGWFLSISKQLAVDYKVAAVVVYVFSVPWKEVLPFYISGAISQMRNISLLEIKFVVPHTSPSYSNNTLKGGAATDDKSDVRHTRQVCTSCGRMTKWLHFTSSQLN